MTSKNMAGILAIIETAYPNIKRSEQERMEAVKLWASLFADDDPEDVLMAVRGYICGDTSGFPPSIGAIKARVSMLRKREVIGEIEAWGLVSKACRNGYYGSVEEFNKLPPMVQRVVGSPSQLRDWSMLDEQSLETVIASNFQRAYRIMESRETEYAALPEKKRELITDGL